LLLLLLLVLERLPNVCHASRAGCIQDRLLLLLLLCCYIAVALGARAGTCVMFPGPAVSKTGCCCCCWCFTMLANMGNVSQAGRLDSLLQLLLLLLLLLLVLERLLYCCCFCCCCWCSNGC
jgi:hypothetical protein